MPQLEHVSRHVVGVGSAAQRHHGRQLVARKRALICLGDAGGDLVGGIVGQQGPQHLAGELEVVLVCKVLKVNGGISERVAHIQPAVGRNAAANRLFGSECGCL